MWFGSRWEAEAVCWELTTEDTESTEWKKGVLRYVLRSGKEGIFFLALKYSSVLSVSSVVKLFMPL
ncbi:MAG: hypothetical protein EBY32_17730 [Proteobacteria bacterium]|nr:hypothetical protein [Pseudomonadota bacterium]